MAVTYNGTSNPPAEQLSHVGGLTIPWTYAPGIGDLNIGYIINKPYTVSPIEGAGWTHLGGVSNGTIPAGSGTGSIAVNVYYKIQSGSDTGTLLPSVSGDTVSMCLFGSAGYSRTAGSGWAVSAAFAADLDSSNQSVLATCTTAPRFQAGDDGLVITTMVDSSGTINSLSVGIPGCVVSSCTRVGIKGTTNGTKGQIEVWRFTVTSGIATGPPTVGSNVSAAKYSTTPLAVIRVGEFIGHERIADPIEITSYSPSSPPAPFTAATTQILVNSPAGAVTYPIHFTEIEPELTVAVTTSSIIRGVEPAAAASEGLTAPVEVQVWDPSNKKMLAVIDGRTGMQWLDDMNDSGSGGFDLSRWDPKATTANLALFNLVRFIYSGHTRFASRIETRKLAIAASGDHTEQIWQINGRGVMGMLSDAALYPEYGVNEFTRKQRSFFFGSKEGTWYLPNEWFQPRGMQQDKVPAVHPWYTHPADWPDPEAQWIWPTNPDELANPGTVWFRSYFTLEAATTVTVYASADDQVTLYVDGFPALATVSGDKHSFRRSSQFSIRMKAGSHLIAAEVLNTDASLEEVKPIVTANEVHPTYANDSNRVYVGKGFTDGGHPYVNSNGSVQNGGTGAAAFDGDLNSYWMSVGNYLGWSSAYEWVEGTYPTQQVTAVKVKLRGGPYTVYVSLKNGGNGWNGGSTIPYAARAVDAGTAIRYVREVRVGNDETVTINVPAQDSDRIRITLKAEWDSGIWQYRWRGGIYDVVITSESREGTYIRGGNFAGLLVTVVTTDDSGAVIGIVHRSKPVGWLCKTGDRPGWRPAHILTQIIGEARERSVLGVKPMTLGFTDDVDSYGVPWTLPRKDVAYGVGDDYLSIVKKLVEDSKMDVWIEPDTLILHAAPSRGDNHTVGVDSVILRPGQSLTDFSVDSNRPSATRLVVESDLGWMEVAEFEPEVTYGRVEGFISLGSALSVEEARSTANNELDRLAIETYDTTIKTTDVVGPRPYVDYDIGDRVLIPNAFSADSQLGVNRVLSFRIAEGDAGELDVTVETDLDLESTGIPTIGAPVDEGGVIIPGEPGVYGVPAGTTLTVMSTGTNDYPGNTFTTSAYKINGSGTFTKMKFVHRVEVHAGSVNFVDCYFAGDTVATAQDVALLNVMTTGTGSATATRCTFNPTIPYDGHDGVRGNRLTLTNCEITRTVDGGQFWNVGSVLVQNCWIHDLIFYDNNSHPGTSVTGTHNDGFQISSGSNYQFLNNLFDGTCDSAGMYISQNLGGVSNLRIEGNKFNLVGNGSDININDANKPGGAAAMTGVTLRNNIFKKDVTKFQMLLTNLTQNHPTTVISGNVWADGSSPPPRVA